jgi:2-methylisocitrate lyase-like PEP mutase family enzyme
MKSNTDGADLEALVTQHAASHTTALLVPGCWNALSAKAIEQGGYHAAWLGVEAIAMARFGNAGHEYVTATIMAQSAAEIRDSCGLALMLDAGNGFGNAFNVGRTVTTLEAAGAQAIQIHDDFSTTRTIDAKRATADMIGKIKAAVDASRGALLIARTVCQPRESLSALMDRARAYAEAGADLIGTNDTQPGLNIAELAAWSTNHIPLVLDCDEELSQAQMTNIAIVCQPMRFQRRLQQAAADLLPRPPAHIAQEASAMAEALVG